MAARNVTDPDVWWHLRTGQLILETHHIPRTDPYSFTKFNTPWTDHEWLTQVIIYATYHVTGWAGLMVEFAFVTALTYGLVFLRSPGRPFIAGAITTWGAVASIPSWGVRPQTLTLLLASLFLFLLDRSFKRPEVLWWLPLLMLFWVNLHAGYALGIALLILYLLGKGLDLAFGESQSSDSARWFREAGLVAFLCVAVVPLNPYGPRLYSYPFETLRSPAMMANITEWLSPNFHQGKHLPLLLLVLAVLGLAALSPKKLQPLQLLLLCATLFAALRSVRHIPIFVLVAVPIVSGMLDSWVRERFGQKVFGDQPRSLHLSKLIFNLLLVLGMVCFAGLRLRYVISHQPAVEAHEFPKDGVSFLAKNQLPGPLLNHYNWGGYFIWKLYPEDQVFIDGRADVYGDAFMNAFAASYYLRSPSWRELLERWNIRTLALPPDSPLISALQNDRGWKTAFSDHQIVILTR